MPLRKLNFQVPPLNETGNGFSPKAGFPIIKFSIASQEGMLETKSLRLVGKFQVKSDSSTIVGPGQIAFGNVGKNADSADIQPCTRPTISPFGGIKTCIDKVVVLSKKVSKELSTDVNYSQYTALRESRFGLKSDFRTSIPSRSFSLGQNAITSQRRFMISQEGGGVQSKNQGQEFSIKLDIPLFQNTLLALDEQHFGGLMISIHLSPESAFFSTFMNGVSTDPAGNNLIDTFRYTLQDLRLEGRIQVPTAQELTAYPQVFPMDNQINLLQDIHSSSSSNTLTPQTAQVKGIVNLFLTQAQTNNLSQNQFSFSMPPGIREQIQAKNSVRYPLKFPLTSSPTYSDSTSVAVGTLTYPSLQINVSESRLQFERSLNDGRLPQYTSADLVLTEESERSRLLATNGNATSSSNLYSDSIGLGSDYTLGLDLAQDFRGGSSYGLVLESGVQTGNAKLMAGYSETALLQQTFVRNRAFFDTVSLTKSF